MRRSGRSDIIRFARTKILMHRNTVTRNWIRPPTIPRVHPDSVRGNTVTFRGMKLADIFVSRYTKRQEQLIDENCLRLPASLKMRV